MSASPSTPPPPQDSAATTTHPLKSAWVLWHLPNPLIGDRAKVPYDEAVKQFTKAVETIHTVEEFWAVVSALPAPSKLPNGDTLMFHREGYSSSWDGEAWQAKVGGRLTFKLDPYAQQDEFFYECLSLIVGEYLGHSTKTGNCCSGVRISKRETKKDGSHMRMEVWLEDKTNTAVVVDYLFAVANKCGVTNLHTGNNYEFKEFA